MCTIMTISRRIFDLDRESVLSQIYADSLTNREGYYLYLMGETPDQDVQITSMTIAPILALIESDGTEWNRLFFHARAATAYQVDVTTCHGWHADAHDGNTWIVMHNGILRDKRSAWFNVDSKLLVSIIESEGIDAAVDHCINGESFANVLLVSPVTREWYCLRSFAGRLHTDGMSNYSTNPIGDICLGVPAGHVEHGQFTNSGNGWKDTWEDDVGLCMEDVDLCSYGNTY